MTDSSEIGRYGTLRLLKRHEPDTTVAFFPIDDETVTFGRSKQCSIRLYYDCVSELHCTLQISEERKAFLLVQGTNGLLVDGCQVNPSGSPSSALTTVPLTNGSEIEIYKKRFKFEYPPKEIRAALLATPRHAKGRRSLRMSMIRSAQVFTPRGSPDAMPQTPPRGHPRQDMDWDALRSPVKFPSQDGSPDQEMMLLDGEGDDAFVLEEEKDIIILEQVDDFREMEVALPSEPKHSRTRSVAFSIPSATPPPRHVPVPQTIGGSHRASPTVHANRRRSAPSLHRAVVLRSAQRALQREQERYEEQQEEEEVVAEVSPERELGPFEVKGHGEEDDIEWNGMDPSQGQDEETSEPNPPIVPSNAPARPARRMSAFRASIDAMRKVIPLPFNWKAPEDVPLPDDDDDDYDEDVEDDGGCEEEGRQQDEPDETLHDEDEDEPVFETPVRRNMGPFMTPQFQFPRPAQRVPVDVKAPGSLGRGVAQKTFGGAQRVRVVPAWKVTDIVLPEPEKLSLVEQKHIVKKEPVSEEERQAIMARRKSALHTPSNLPAPGPRTFTFPIPAQSDIYTPGEDSDEDAETMLEKMKQKMANVRRKSEARKMRISVGGLQQGDEFSLLAPGSERKGRAFIDTGITEETLSQMKHAELDNPSVSKKSFDANRSAPGQDRDDMDLLGTSSDDDDDRPKTKGVPMPVVSSLTPRFDGVREMFRQPRVEPKTPSFAGFKTMFKERSEAMAKTPSFRGVREMFNRAGGHPGLATPRLDLAEMFKEDETVGSSTEEDQVLDELHEPSTSRIRSSPAVKSEDDTVASTPALKMSTRTRKAATSATRSSKKKDVPPVDVPSAVVEEQVSDHEQEDDDPIEIEPTPAPAVRRVTKRTAKDTATPAAGDAPPSEEVSGRGASRNTKKATPVVSEDTTKGIVVHKTRKSRRHVDDNSDDEEPVKPTVKASTGRGKRKNHQAAETQVEQEDEQEIPVRPKGRSRKAKEIETSESEGIAPTKPRRARAVKTPQGPSEPTESTSVPTAPKPSRRVKVEDSSDVEGPAPVPKAPKPKRGARAKTTVEPVDVSPNIIEEHSSEVEDATPAPVKGRSSKKGGNKKTPIFKDTTVDEKENSGDQLPKSSDKTPATRTRRAAVTPVEALDAPAKRTRSRK